jgi:diacylglycerol kinase family enzyme
VIRTKRVAFILNGKAGSCDPAKVSEAAKRVAEKNGALSEVHINADSDLHALVKGALKDGAQIVVGGGGDGTISAIAGALIGSDVPLGVLPLGTLNHFAKDLKIPLGLDEALENIFMGAESRIDVGEVNGRVFINNSGVGLYPRVVEERQAIQKHGYPKWLALARATIREVKAHSLVRVSLTTRDGRKFTRVTPFLFVGNNEFKISGLRIGTRERLDDGWLWVCLAPEAGRLQLAAMTVLALAGLLRKRDLESFKATGVELTTWRKHQKVSSDGEVVLLDTPLHYSCRPGALRVIVPLNEAGSAPRA